ncbi:ABC transporter permease, partial [Arthrobacter sp. SPG23]
MSAAVHAHPESGPVLGVGGPAKNKRVLSEAGHRGQWWRFVAILAITAVVLVPIMVTVVLAFTPGPTSTATGLTFENLANVFDGTLAATWLQNSLITTLSTVLV